MRVFSCDRCGRTVGFDAFRCGACDAELGYVTADRVVRAVVPAGDSAEFRIDGHDEPFWRCLNAAWGCNWMLPAGGGAWCRSCSLTRGRPDEGRPDAIDAWMAAEAAKRHLVHQLDSLGLPIEARSPEAPDGLAFDLVSVPGETAVTGHLDGVVTLDLAETDEVERHRLRRQLGEPFRTVLGHLRHEIGHHYWNRLIGQSDDLAEFGRLFGDVDADYGDALATHYATSAPEWDRDRYVSAYATSHPLEDWAETFAHYLHVVDLLDTAAAHGLGPATVAEALTTEAMTTDALVPDIAEILDAAAPIIAALNAMAASLGSPAVYPLEFRGAVVDKLDFVHRQIAAHSERGRFYAAH